MYSNYEKQLDPIVKQLPVLIELNPKQPTLWKPCFDSPVKDFYITSLIIRYESYVNQFILLCDQPHISAVSGNFEVKSVYSIRYTTRIDKNILT